MNCFYYFQVKVEKLSSMANDEDEIDLIHSPISKSPNEVASGNVHSRSMIRR